MKVLGLSVAVLAVLADQHRNNGTDTQEHSQSSFEKNINESLQAKAEGISTYYASSYPKPGNLTRRQRTGRGKGILFVPSKEMVCLSEFKIALKYI